MGVKFSELPVMHPQDISSDDYYAVLDVSDGVLKKKRIEIPLTTAHGGTGNIYGYIRTGLKDGGIAGANSTAEGLDNITSGYASHAEGRDNISAGQYSHAEGKSSSARGESSHAEGTSGYASGKDSHAEGTQSRATGDSSHAEGVHTEANAQGAHAEGYLAHANGLSSHAEGANTVASGSYSHAQNCYTTASGESSSALGRDTKASGTNSLAAGKGTIAEYDNQTVIGTFNDPVSGVFVVGIGQDEHNAANAMWIGYDGETQFTKDLYCFGEIHSYDGASFNGNVSVYGDLRATTFIGPDGEIPKIIPNPSDPSDDTLNKLQIGNTIYEVDGGGGLPSDPLSVDHGGTGNTAGYIQIGQAAGTTIGTGATAEGYNNTSSNNYTHAEGRDTSATNRYAHAEGYSSTASGIYSHAEGNSSTASSDGAHAEGNSTASGHYSHSEGQNTEASGLGAHAEGAYTIASGITSHAQGMYTTANGLCTFVGGRGNSPSNPLSVNTNNAFVYGDRARHKFIDGPSSITAEGPCFGVVAGLTICSNEGLYDATYGFTGTVGNTTDCTLIYLQLEAGAIYMLNEQYYRSNTGSIAGYSMSVICSGLNNQNPSVHHIAPDSGSASTITVGTDYIKITFRQSDSTSYKLMWQGSLIRLA